MEQTRVVEPTRYETAQVAQVVHPTQYQTTEVVREVPVAANQYTTVQTQGEGVLQDVERPHYNKRYNQTYEHRRDVVAEADPEKKKTCCAPWCWALWGCCGCLALLLGLLFGLGVLGGFNGPDLDANINAPDVDINGPDVNINGPDVDVNGSLPSVNGNIAGGIAGGVAAGGAAAGAAAGGLFGNGEEGEDEGFTVVE